MCLGAGHSSSYWAMDADSATHHLRCSGERQLLVDPMGYSPVGFVASDGSPVRTSPRLILVCDHEGDRRGQASCDRCGTHGGQQPTGPDDVMIDMAAGRLP